MQLSPMEPKTKPDWIASERRKAPVWGKLNSFQRTMLQWNDLHPYNAIHVVRVCGELDGNKLEQAVRGTLESLSLTGLVLNRQMGIYSYKGGSSAAEIRYLGGSANPSSAAETRRSTSD